MTLGSAFLPSTINSKDPQLATSAESGGVKGGKIIGSTDEFGFRAVQDRVHINDLHATILKLPGLDHEKLTFLFEGRNMRLTDVGGENDIPKQLLSGSRRK